MPVGGVRIQGRRRHRGRELVRKRPPTRPTGRDRRLPFAQAVALKTAENRQIAVEKEFKANWTRRRRRPRRALVGLSPAFRTNTSSTTAGKRTKESGATGRENAPSRVHEDQMGDSDGAPDAQARLGTTIFAEMAERDSQEPVPALLEMGRT